jgi:hypothetical protein
MIRCVQASSLGQAVKMTWPKRRLVENMPRHATRGRPVHRSGRRRGSASGTAGRRCHRHQCPEGTRRGLQPMAGRSVGGQQADAAQPMDLKECRLGLFCSLPGPGRAALHELSALPQSSAGWLSASSISRFRSRHLRAASTRPAFTTESDCSFAKVSQRCAQGGIDLRTLTLRGAATASRREKIAGRDRATRRASLTR